MNFHKIFWYKKSKPIKTNSDIESLFGNENQVRKNIEKCHKITGRNKSQTDITYLLTKICKLEAAETRSITALNECYSTIAALENGNKRLSTENEKLTLVKGCNICTHIGAYEGIIKKHVEKEQVLELKIKQLENELTNLHLSDTEEWSKLKNENKELKKAYNYRLYIDACYAMKRKPMQYKEWETYKNKIGTEAAIKAVIKCRFCDGTGKPCNSCGEYHSSILMCPPHEIRMKWAENICPECGAKEIT